MQLDIDAANRRIRQAMYAWLVSLGGTVVDDVERSTKKGAAAGTILLLEEMARVKKLEGESDAAHALLARVYEARCTTVGPTDPAAIQALTTLVEGLRSENKLSDAVIANRKALDGMQEQLALRDEVALH
eukprot:693496-Prymnesium_polylepis.1